MILNNKDIIILIGAFLVLLAGYFMLKWSAGQNESIDIDLGFGSEITNSSDYANKIDGLPFTEMFIKLNPIEGSLNPQSGSVLILSSSEGLLIEVSVEMSKVQQPVEMRYGACNDNGGLAYSINSLVEGVSKTVLPISLNALLAKSPISIVVFESMDNRENMVACGQF